MKFILDDLEQPKAERIFVDRIEPRKAFWDAFSTAQKGLEEPFVLHYYGVGGIGKTSLHSQLVKELQKRCPNAKYVELDFDFVERREPYRVMGLLKKKLSQTWDFQFPMFDVACYTFLCRIGEDADKSEMESFVSGSQVLNFLCDAASMIPGTSMISSILKLVDEGVAVARNLFSNKKQILRTLDTMDIRQLRDQLPIYFASDLRTNLKKEKQPFVIFLDTYEKLVNEFSGVGEPLQNDLWIRGSGGLIPRLPNTLWVLGGREKLKWPQLDAPGTWDSVLHQYLLGTLAEADAQTFLLSAGVEEPAIRKHIYALSDGLPVSLDLYVEQYLREGNISDNLAPSALHERVVRYMSEEEKNACYLLAALGEWTQEQAIAFAKSTGVSLSPALLERLCGFSFILSQDGVTFHIMRKVGEVLLQHCPASLGRALAARKPLSSVKSTTPVLDFASSPEKYVQITLQTFQDENACVNWILEELDSPLTSMCQRLDLDTYFSVIEILKNQAVQTWPNGVLETLADGYNGIGLHYAAHPEQSQKILTDALHRMAKLGHLPALYTVMEQYGYVTLCLMNATDFVKEAEPVWKILEQSGNSSYAGRAAQLLAEAYEMMDLSQESQVWSQRSAQREAPRTKKKVRSEDSRLSAIEKELSECIGTETFSEEVVKTISQEEMNRIHSLLEEGRRIVVDLYGPESRKAFQWYMKEGMVYTNTGDFEHGLASIRQLLDGGESYYGKTSGTYAMLETLYGFVKLMACCARGECKDWPSCSSSFANSYPVLNLRLGENSQCTRQTYLLWKATDAGNLSLEEYRGRMRDLVPELESQQDDINSVFLELIDNLEYLPEEVNNLPALEVIEEILGGAAIAASEEMPSQPEESSNVQEEKSEAIPEQSEQEQSQITMEEVIQELMATYKPNGLYTAPTGIPEKKLRNALQGYGEDPKCELASYVLALYDATALGSAKNGFLLFTSGVLYRESGSKQGAITLEDLEPFTVRRKNTLVLNSKNSPDLASFVSLDAKNAAEVLNCILENLKTQE